MPRKLIELMKDLKEAGFYEIEGGGKGSHRKFGHLKFQGIVTLSGHSAMMPNIIRKSKLKTQ